MSWGGDVTRVPLFSYPGSRPEFINIYGLHFLPWSAWTGLMQFMHASIATFHRRVSRQLSSWQWFRKVLKPPVNEDLRRQARQNEGPPVQALLQLCTCLWSRAVSCSTEFPCCMPRMIRPRHSNTKQQYLIYRTDTTLNHWQRGILLSLCTNKLICDLKDHFGIAWTNFWCGVAAALFTLDLISAVAPSLSSTILLVLLYIASPFILMSSILISMSLHPSHFRDRVIKFDVTFKVIS